MNLLRQTPLALLALIVPAMLLLVACRGDDEGLSRAEVEEIIKAALAGIPQSQPGLTSAEAEQIARGIVASIPAKSTPAEYTRFFVENAISRYETQGLEATLAYYNQAETIDGKWVTTDTVRMWVAESGGFVFGSGWHHDESGG